MLKGITYYIEFNVSLADISTKGINSLGMFLTHNPADLTLNGWLNYHHRTPQIPNTFPSTTAFLNYTGWTKICGYYTPAVDGVKYLIIGRFRDEFYTASGSPGYNGQTTSRPIYYVDGVYIQPYSCCPENKYFQNTSSLPAKTSVNNEVVAGYNVMAGSPGNVNVTSGQTVTFQSGNQILLKPGFSAQTGSTFSTVLAECERGIDDNQLAVAINVDDSTPGQYTLTAVASHGSGGYTYRWSTGATTSSIIITDDPGTYTVVVTDNIPDASTPAPCNVRTGIGEFIIECVSCRQAAVTDKPEVGVSGEAIDEAYQVYPNPSNGLFTLNLRKEKISYGVYGLNGTEVLRATNDSGLDGVILDLRTRGKGKYVLRVIDTQNKSFSRLIFVE